MSPSQTPPMDAFVFNFPAQAHSERDQALLREMTHDEIWSTLVDDSFVPKSDKGKAPQRQDVTQDWDFWPEYASEEEIASPIATEDFELDSTSSKVASTPSLRESSSLERLPANATSMRVVRVRSPSLTTPDIEQLCSWAQAVPLLPAGRPRIVSVRKSPNHSPSSSTAQSLGKSASVETLEAPRPHIARHDERSSSPMFSRRPPLSPTEKAPPMPASRAPADQPLESRMPRSRKSMVLPKRPHNWLQAETMPASVPLCAQRVSEQRAEMKRTNTNIPARPQQPDTLSSQSRHRLLKFSSTFNLRGIGSSRRQDSTSSSDSDQWMTDMQRPTTSASSQVYTLFSDPSPIVSKTKAKLIPRGANERAPLLILPPFSEEVVDEWTLLSPSQWMAHNDSCITNEPSRRMSFDADFSARRKTFSKPLVSARA